MVKFVGLFSESFTLLLFLLKIKKIWPELSEIRSDISTVTEANAKYHPYLKRQEEDIKLLKKEEGQKIPHNFDFSVLQGLSAEVREKLLNVKPQTIAQVKRIPGQRINITHAKYYHYL